MILEAEGLAPTPYPNEQQVRSLVASLQTPKPTFASLTDKHGSYVQVAGARPWCMVEWRQIDPLVHRRANAESVRRPYKDGAMIHFGAGPIALQADEWLLLKQAADIFAAFLKEDAFPSYVRWRVINSKIGLTE